MGEKGNAVEGIPTSAGTTGGASLLGQAGTATANVVLDTGETLRGKLVEGAAEGAVQASKERLRRQPSDDDPEDGSPRTS
ncbi:MAG TPA: hypothetical protein VM933_08960 [Acidimicrobiales bacterium]|nr:hypothetical protein [Acidimicrobiales bacterium]